MNTRDQSVVRLRTIAVVAVGLLLLGVLRPGVTPVRAAAEDDLTSQAPYSTSSTVPDTNPYSNPTQCVYRAWDLAAQAGYKLPYFGNAKEWRQGAISAGYTVADSLGPEAVHSVAVWGGGVGGASVYGHVGWVVDVRDGEFLVQDRNWVAYGTDGEHWVTWVPGISFIILEGAEPAPAPTPAPEPTAEPTAEPSPTPAPSPTPEPTSTPAPTETPAPPTPVPWVMATAAPADALLEQDVLAGRRTANSPASRSPRGSVAVVDAPSPIPWYAVPLASWSDILGLSTPDAGLLGAVDQPMGPARSLAAPALESAPGEGVALPGEAATDAPTPEPSPTAGE